MPDAAQILWLADLFFALRHLLTKPFFGFQFCVTDLLICQAIIQARLVGTNIPAHHHKVIFVGHVVAVDQIPAVEVSELHLDQCTLSGLQPTYVFSSREERMQRKGGVVEFAHQDAVYISLQGAKLFEVNVYRVRPAGGYVVIQEPLFSGSSKNTVSRVVRIECATNRIPWSLDPESPRLKGELPLPGVVRRRQVWIRAECCWNGWCIGREPWFRVPNPE